VRGIDKRSRTREIPGDTKGWRRLGWCDVERVVKERGMRLSQVRRVRGGNRGEKGNVVRVGVARGAMRDREREYANGV